MASKIRSKPGYYKGRLYRSQLEMKWAAMFGLLQWRVEYEPCVMHQWLPDFAIYTRRATFSRIIYAEIKPILARTDPGVKEVVEKLNRNGGQPGIDILLLGAQPIVDEDESVVKTPILGWLVNSGNYPEERCEGISDFAIWSKTRYPKQNTQYDFSAFYGEPGLRIAGIQGQHRSVPHSEVMSLWARACNQVQWRPPKVKS